jgi:ribosomal protein L32
VVTVDVEPPQPPPLSKCPKCGSTRRAPYWQKVERAISGVKDGKLYSKVVWRRTKCLDCGQHRRDKSFV